MTESQLPCINCLSQERRDRLAKPHRHLLPVKTSLAPGAGSLTTYRCETCEHIIFHYDYTIPKDRYWMLAVNVHVAPQTQPGPLL